MTKQDQANEFREWLKQNEDDPEETTTTGVIAYWLQKQDQLLTELGESLEISSRGASCDRHDEDGNGANRQTCPNCIAIKKALDKALFLINKYK